MRLIKFRAWDKTENAMFEWDDLLQERIDEVFADFNDTWKVMQFTGLLDKNGKEIYEGDIVEYGKVHRGIVKWENDGFVADIREKGTDLRCYYKWDAIEIIGNIYENPNLLSHAKKI